MQIYYVITVPYKETTTDVSDTHIPAAEGWYEEDIFSFTIASPWTIHSQAEIT